MFRINQIRAKCIGCFACVEASPQRWRISRKDGRSILVDGKQSGIFHTTIAGNHEWEENQLAALNCPVKIITLSPL